MARASEKQRLKANRQRLRLLLTWAVLAGLLYIAGSKLHRRSFSWHWLLFIFDNILIWSIYFVLAKAAAPAFDRESGVLIDAGQDLRAPGIMEYLHDALYTALLAETFAAFWIWFWLLLAAMPAYMVSRLFLYLAQTRRVSRGTVGRDAKASRAEKRVRHGAPMRVIRRRP
jgi:hypothetical protein